MKKCLLYILISYLSIGYTFSQKKQVSLEEIIVLAKSQSPGFKRAELQKRIGEYSYRNSKIEFLPSVSLSASAPSYNNAFSSVRQPDGSIEYRSVDQNNSNISINLSQKIPLTGGNISLNTNLSRFDNFKSRTKRYSGSPIYLSLSQPLFSFNPSKWQKKTALLEYEESKKEYAQEMQSIAREVTSLYINVLEAQTEVSIEIDNLKNAKANYEIINKRVRAGTETENNLLQWELQMLKSRQNLEKTRYEWQLASRKLASVIGMEGKDTIKAVAPDDIIDLEIDLPKAVEYARRYRPEFVAFEKRKLMARQEIERTKKSRYQVNLSASYGLNNAANSLEYIYQNPNQRQTFGISFSAPVLDWGRTKTKYNSVKAALILTDINNEMDEETIVQEIIALVNSFDLLNKNIQLSQKANSVALKNDTISNKLYQAGKISLSDLVLAQNEKDNTLRNYISSLRQYWESYYLLKQLTLYDFERDEPIIKK